MVPFQVVLPPKAMVGIEAATEAGIDEVEVVGEAGMSVDVTVMPPTTVVEMD